MPEKGIWTKTYSTRDQVPDPLVFTRAKSKFPSRDFNNFADIIVTLTQTLWPINSGVLTSLLLPHLSSSLTDSLLSMNILCHSKTDARFMQDARKAVWSIPTFLCHFSKFKTKLYYRSSKVSNCIFEIHQLWQSGISSVYSNCYCSSSFEPEIINIGQSYKTCSNNILSATILNACTKNVSQLIDNTRHIYIYVCVCVCVCLFVCKSVCLWMYAKRCVWCNNKISKNLSEIILL